MSRVTSEDDLHYLHREIRERLVDDSDTLKFFKDTFNDGVWFWDLENPEEEWMSDGFWRVLGFDPATKEHKGREWRELVHEEDLALAIENLERHCADPTHPYDQVVRYHHANGGTVWMRCRGIAIRDDSGKPVRMFGVYNDLSATKSRELEARALNRLLEKRFAENDALTKEITAWVSGLSHDLKSPINTLGLLMAELEYELGADVSSEVDQLLRQGRKVVAQATSVIDAVLEYTLAFSQEGVMIPVDLNDLIEEVRGDLADEIVASGARLAVGDLPLIRGNRAQLKVLFSQLIRNAIKYQSADAKPLVRVRNHLTRSARVRIGVLDNGIGIAEPMQQEIFALFHRLHRQADYEGTGIGLATCQRIASNHGGWLEVSSELGKGSEFFLTLPSILEGTQPLQDWDWKERHERG